MNDSPLEGRTVMTEKELGCIPLLLEHIDTTDKHRISVILDEFIKGFRFVQQYKSSVSFFGSARVKDTNENYLRARTLAKRIVEEIDYSIVTGGGPGIMEAANRGACDGGGRSLAITIELPKEQTTNAYVQKSVDFHYFFVRKVMLAFSAEAYIYFPGGFGTMDELFEILTLIQTRKTKKVPIILVGHDHWSNFDEYIRSQLLAKNAIEEEDTNLYTITDDNEQIIEIIKEIPIQNGITEKQQK